MKAVLKKALVLAKNGVEQKEHSNGCSENGSHEDDCEKQGAMETQVEGEIKSPSTVKGKGGRRNKADAESKSEFYFTIQFSTCLCQLLCV